MVSRGYTVSIHSIEYLIRLATGECTVAIAVLIEVPARFTPEASAASSGQNGIVLNSALIRATRNLQNCFISPHGTNIGWAKARK